jgi:hypothetical protein
MENELDHGRDGAALAQDRKAGGMRVNTKYQQLSVQWERERDWPGPYQRELTPEEVAARNLPPGRYATAATVQVTCDFCGYEYPIVCLSTCVPQCPRCHFGMPYFPQKSFDFQRAAQEKLEEAELAWPPIATREDWKLRRHVA